MFNDFDLQVGAKPELSYGDLLAKNVLSTEDLRVLDIPPRRKFLGPIAEGTIGEVFGPRGVGKTQLRDALALSLTRGADLGPWLSETPAGVLILDGEMSLFDLQSRQSLECNVGAPCRPLHTISSQYLFETGRVSINLTDEKWRAACLELIEKNPQYEVIFFDNLSSFMPGSKENDSESWGAVNQLLLSIRWLGRAVVFVHHAGKSGDQRGTSAREDQLDWVVRLDNASSGPESGCRFQATLTKNRSLFGPEAEPFIFQLDGEPPRWTITLKRQSQREIIIALLASGIPQKEVSGLTGFDKGLVSRTKKKAIIDGELDSSGALFTFKGEAKYGGINIDEFLKS